MVMYEWFFSKTKELVKPVVDGFSSRTGERTADVVVGTVVGVISFKGKLEHLKQDSARLSCVASDVAAQVKNEELGGRKKRKREVEKWLEAVHEIQGDIGAVESEIQEKGWMSRLNFDHVEKLNERVQNLIEQRQHLVKFVVDHATRGDPLLTSKMCGAAFQENVKQIWNCLVDRNVHVMGIHGSAGVGKTALAKNVHNQVLDQTQGRAYWVSISKTTSIKKLQDEISRAIGITLSGENDQSKRASKLHHTLMQKKDFVLILDNLGENIDLEEVGCPLNVDGCQLIITSRSLNVCRRVGCQKIFEVKTLGEEDAWTVFKEAFGQGAVFAPGVEEIARSAVQMYTGLPQGIVELGKRMKGVTGSISEWRNELAEIEDSFEGKDDFVDRFFF